MKILKSILVFMIILGSISAQNFAGKLNPFPSSKPNLPENDVLNILCVMVEFQEDLFDKTYGNGKFGTIYSKDYGNTIIDPLPHDAAYFSNHMTFAQNYFTKVSNGNLNVQFTILPEIITVSQTMREYSVPSNSDDFTPLADFSQEVWQLADQRFTNTNFGDYDLFFIFHAGAGKDIADEFGVGARSDLQSLYLSEKALKKVYGNDFNGFPVNGGSFNIINSAILPETENREISVIGGVELLELSINGLIVAMIASHIGLPDLFNTETGKSAIGKFGLMDGQSIFAYGGLFPPEPSAWEKIYLGWDTARELEPNGNTYTIVNPIIAEKLASPDAITIGRVNINSNEYYLIENKKRDANLDGIKITAILDGQQVEYNFAKDDTSTITPGNISKVDGVVIDVDEYDWAVSGFEVGQRFSDPFEDIGLQIWHIDEAVINAKLADNKINTDPDRPGIQLVEADGVREIGFEFETLTGTFIGEGTKEDTWYSGNPANYYENEFTPDSKPATTTNLGANSFISFKNFSEIGPQMSFELNYEYGQTEKVFSLEIPFSGNTTQIKSLDINGDQFHLILSDQNLIFVNGTNIIVDQALANFSENYFAVMELNGSVVAVGSFGRSINLVEFSSGGQYESISFDIGERITSQPVIRNFHNDILQILVGTESGNINQYDYNETEKSFSLKNTFNAFSGKSVEQILDFNSGSVAVANDAVFNNFGQSIDIENMIIKSILTEKSPGAISGSFSVVALDESGNFYITNETLIIDDFSIDSQSNGINFSLIDIFNNGENYIVVNDSSQINAFNLSGAQAENFPFKDPEGKKFVGIPLGADITNDGRSEVIAFTEDGRIFAFDASVGKVVNGFPISTGSVNKSTPVLFESLGEVFLTTVNSNNDLTVWKLGNGSINWAEEFGDLGNRSFIESASGSNKITEFFPKSKAYNWPNPVYDGETFIRYYVAEDSDVNIKIFDLAGDFVAELNHNGIGGIDNEVAWNVSEIQSGVYFARLEVNGHNGQSDHKIIKIAVIK